MTSPEQSAQSYLDTLLLYHEEEVMGEAWFRGLEEHFPAEDEVEKLDLLARVERHAAEAVRPLLCKYQLTPRSDDELYRLGRLSCEKYAGWNWRQFATDMAERFPGYIDDFEGLENMAPADDLPALKFLTEHEVVAIDFAKLELAGSPDSKRPLLDYLNSPHPAAG